MSEATFQTVAESADLLRTTPKAILRCIVVSAAASPRSVVLAWAQRLLFNRDKLVAYAMRMAP